MYSQSIFYLLVANVQASTEMPVMAEGRTIQEIQEGFARLLIGAAEKFARPSYGMHHGYEYDSPYKFIDFLHFAKHSEPFYRNMLSMASERYSLHISLDHLENDIDAWHQKLDAMIVEVESADVLIYSCDADKHSVMLDNIPGTEGKENVHCIDPDFLPDFVRFILDLTTAGVEIPSTSSEQLSWLADFESELKVHATDVYAKLGEWKEKLRHEVEPDSDIDFVIRSYHLTRSFLVSPLKLRQRDEFQEKNQLSIQIPFMDEILGTDHTLKGNVMSMYPYYLGYSTWGFMQSYAEAIAAQHDVEQNRKYIADYFAWFQYFKEMYACPFCKYHLTREVQHTKEVEMYPLEYTFFNLPDSAEACVDSDRDVPEYFQIDLAQKISVVLRDTTGHQFKMFLWALHNTVSSSIGRSEAWYPNIKSVKENNRMEECGVEYTLRWWPRTDLLSAFKGLERHRDYLPRLSKELKNKSCRNIGEDAEVQKIKAEVASLFQQHGEQIAEELRRSYSLVASKPDQIQAAEYDKAAQNLPALFDSIRTCTYVISDPLPITLSSVHV